MTNEEYADLLAAEEVAADAAPAAIQQVMTGSLSSRGHFDRDVCIWLTPTLVEYIALPTKEQTSWKDQTIARLFEQFEDLDPNNRCFNTADSRGHYLKVSCIQPYCIAMLTSDTGTQATFQHLQPCHMQDL